LRLDISLQLFALQFNSVLAIEPDLFLFRPKSLLAIAFKLLLLWFNSLLAIQS